MPLTLFLIQQSTAGTHILIFSLAFVVALILFGLSLYGRETSGAHILFSLFASVIFAYCTFGAMQLLTNWDATLGWISIRDLSMSQFSQVLFIVSALVFMVRLLDAMVVIRNKRRDKALIPFGLDREGDRD